MVINHCVEKHNLKMDNMMIGEMIYTYYPNVYI